MERQLNAERDRKMLRTKDVRDFDFENCHPGILDQLLKKNGLFGGKFLDKYSKDKQKTMEEYKIDDKHEVINMINTEVAPNNQEFKQLHEIIYKKLIPILLKDETNKNILSRIKRERNRKGKHYNYNGTFISHYLQDIENNMLMSFYKWIDV